MEKIYKGEIQRLFPILEAIKEGKTIQWNDMGKWRDIDGDEEGFFLDTFVGKPDGYRIKPESKYRPFVNAEECWAEMQKHQPFGWLKVIRENARTIVNYIHNKGVIFSNGSVSFERMFDNYTFADGTPFGVKAEE